MSLAAGLDQLDRYLARVWIRTGIPIDAREDCTQSVFLKLLFRVGSGPFARLIENVGEHGIPAVLSRETRFGPEFFRAVDAVKHRAIRERRLTPLDSVDEQNLAMAVSSIPAIREEIREHAVRLLTPIEVLLIDATLDDEDPVDTARRIGFRVKSVYNVKSRAVNKLRDALASH